MNGSRRHVLYLCVGDAPLAWDAHNLNGDAEVELFKLTEADAPEALRKIFAADSVLVWGEVEK